MGSLGLPNKWVITISKGGGTVPLWIQWCNSLIRYAYRSNEVFLDKYSIFSHPRKWLLKVNAEWLQSSVFFTLQTLRHESSNILSKDMEHNDLRPFVAWFFSRITQKLLNRFSQNLEGGWVSAQNRLHSLLVCIQIKGAFSHFLQHWTISQEFLSGQKYLAYLNGRYL